MTADRQCHNDCDPGYGGTCTTCGEECTADPYYAEQLTIPGRYCSVCGENEGSYWAGKHCTFIEGETTCRGGATKV